VIRAEQWQEWETRVAAYRSSGQSVREWCAANGVKPERLWYWLRWQKAGPATPPLTWLPVAVDGPVPRGQSDTGLLVRVGRASIEVNPGFDPEMLSTVVRVLSTVC
jgi:hypothetical protein